jgi:hypothetical protein
MLVVKKFERMAERAREAASRWSGSYEADRQTCLEFADWATEQAKARREQLTAATDRPRK